MLRCPAAVLGTLFTLGCASAPPVAPPPVAPPPGSASPPPSAAASVTAPASAAPASPATPVSVRLIRAGVTLTEVSGEMPAPQTGLGWVHVTPAKLDPTFVSEGPTVHAKLGTGFGIEVIVDGRPRLAMVQLRTRVTHPPLTNPGTGLTLTVDEWPSPMNAGILRYDGWSFDNPWELVAGSWVFELLDGERVLLRQEFTVDVTP